MPTRSLTNSLTRSPAGGVAGVGVASLPTPTHYVSQTATNGYAVGVNSGAGTSKAAPWLTLDYAIANAPAGSVVVVNDGTYTAATFYNVRKDFEIRAQNYGQVICRGAAAQASVFNVSAFTSGPNIRLTLRGIVVDGEAARNYLFIVGSSAVSSAVSTSVALYSCQLKDFVISGLLNNGNKNSPLTIGSCTASGTMSGNVVSYESVEVGHIEINGLAATMNTTGAGGKHVVRVVAAANGVTARASSITGSISNASTTAVFGVTFINVPAVIENCDVDTSSLATTGHLYSILSNSATLTANGGIIRNNSGHAGQNGGYAVLYGTDGSLAGNNNHNNPEIYGNTLTANASSTNPIHGLMIGYGQGGSVYDNSIAGAGIGLLAKNQTNLPVFRNNTVTGAWFAGMYARGADARFEDNDVEVVDGRGVYCDRNNSDTNRDGTSEFSGNTLRVNAAPDFVVDVDPFQAATFDTNTYLVGGGVTLPVGAWTYQATGYDTLAAWKAAVEPTALP